jgi:hypothetical protein
MPHRPMLAALMLIGVSCAADVADDESEARAAGSGDGEESAVPELMHRGVVSLAIRGQHDCTGVLIGPYHALTAAHCSDQAGTGEADGSMRRTIDYYDPARGRRPITAAMERLNVHILPSWKGLPESQERGRADLQSDLAVIERVESDGVTPRAWEETTPLDYIPIWLGAIREVDKNTFYGGGIDDRQVGQLSSMAIDINGSESNYFWDLGNTHRVCKGDSGGPYLDTVAEYDEAVLGIAIAGEGVDADHPCTRKGGRQFGIRLNTRIDWINEKTGGMCTTFGSIAQCF